MSRSCLTGRSEEWSRQRRAASRTSQDGVEAMGAGATARGAAGPASRLGAKEATVSPVATHASLWLLACASARFLQVAAAECSAAGGPTASASSVAIQEGLAVCIAAAAARDWGSPSEAFKSSGRVLDSITSLLRTEFCTHAASLLLNAHSAGDRPDA